MLSRSKNKKRYGGGELDPTDPTVKPYLFYILPRLLDLEKLELSAKEVGQRLGSANKLRTWGRRLDKLIQCSLGPLAGMVGVGIVSSALGRLVLGASRWQSWAAVASVSLASVGMSVLWAQRYAEISSKRLRHFCDDSLQAIEERERRHQQVVMEQDLHNGPVSSEVICRHVCRQEGMCEFSKGLNDTQLNNLVASICTAIEKGETAGNWIPICIRGEPKPSEENLKKARQALPGFEIFIP